MAGAATGRQGVRAGGRISAHPRRRRSARRIGGPSGVVRRRRSHGQRPRRQRARPDARRRAAPADRRAALRHRDGRLADAAATSWPSWPSRAATRARRSKSFRFTDGVDTLDDLRPGMTLAGHRHQRHRLRRLRRHRRPPGRPGPHQPARRPLRQGCQRRGQSPAAGAGDRPRSGPGAQAHRAVDAQERVALTTNQRNNAQLPGERVQRLGCVRGDVDDQMADAKLGEGPQGLGDLLGSAREWRW